MPQEVDGSGEIEDGSNSPAADSNLPLSPAMLNSALAQDPLRQRDLA